uniref:Uncharacterized protein n=1 Tax=Glossina brevipalpis TaxID=37001 RepID=A0A1A9WJZ1_9MUSC
MIDIPPRNPYRNFNRFQPSTLYRVAEFPGSVEIRNHIDDVSPFRNRRLCEGFCISSEHALCFNITATPPTPSPTPTIETQPTNSANSVNPIELAVMMMVAMVVVAAVAVARRQA